MTLLADALRILGIMGGGGGRSSKQGRRSLTRRVRAARTRTRPLFFEQEEPRILLVGSPWHNNLLALDVNADTFVTAGDSLIILNMLNANGGAPVPVPANAVAPPYPDVTNDWWVSQADYDAVIALLGDPGGTDPGTNGEAPPEVPPDDGTGDNVGDTGESGTLPPGEPPLTQPPPTQPPASPDPAQEQIVATDFDYLGTAPSAANLFATGFNFVWRMEFNQAAANLVAHQIVETTIEGFDASGTLIHTLTIQIRDIMTLGGGPAPQFIDMQDLSGYQRTLDNWATTDGVTKFVFTRRGDMRLVDPAGIQIMNSGAVRPYVPGTDIEGMVFSVVDVDGTLLNSGSMTTPNAPLGPNIGDAVRFTGTARYRAVWEESVITTYVPANWLNPLSSPTYTRNGSIIWKSNVGGAVGAVGVPVFPEKAQFDVPTPWIDVSATSTGNKP